jgi:uncharacterized protein YkwD
MANRLRARHDAPPLVRDKRLDVYAQYWARHLATSVRGLQHSSGKYGENLYWTSANRPKKTACMEAIRAWYNEIFDIDWNDPTANFDKVGHATALLWIASKRIGFGVARDPKDGSTYVVASFDPPGNVWTRTSILANVRPAQQ